MRIAVTTSFGYWGAFTLADLFEPGGTRMIGGGETAMCWLTRSLAEAGNEVDLFYDVQRPGRCYGVNVMPKSFKIPMLSSVDYDVLIAWEDTQVLGLNHRADLVVYAVQCNAMHLGILDYGVDLYQMVSRWHADTLYNTDPVVDPSKFFIVPNGVDLTRYRQQPTVQREPYRIIHSSSPDRGLHHLLHIWPQIIQRLPEATLHIYYDMTGWFNVVDAGKAQDMEVNTAPVADALRAALAATEGMGVFVHGGIGQWELAREQQKASLLVYPCTPVSPTEGFSVTVLEALAAGTPVITTDADAFPELWGDCTVQIPRPFEGKESLWVEHIVGMLTDQRRWARASEKGKKKAATLQWQDIGASYAGLIADSLKEKRAASGELHRRLPRLVAL